MGRKVNTKAVIGLVRSIRICLTTASRASPRENGSAMIETYTEVKNVVIETDDSPVDLFGLRSGRDT